MASTDPLERAVLDGSLFNQANIADPDGPEPLRAPSPSYRWDRNGTLSRSPSPTTSSSRPPSLSAGSDGEYDPDTPASREASPPHTRHGPQASRTGPKGVIADYRIYKSSAGPRGPTGKGRTGPKGVISDWKQFTDRDRERSTGTGAFSNGGRTSISSRMRRGGSGRSRKSGDDDLSFDEEDYGLDEEEEEEDVRAREAYRNQRMAEMKKPGGAVGVPALRISDDEGEKSRRPSPARRHDANGKVFGHLREIGLEQFQSAVESEDREVAVVIHLYDPHVSACASINSLLSALARRLPHTKFLRALASEVDFAQGIEADALPTVLVYRGGELESTLVRIDLEMELSRDGVTSGGRERDLLDVLVKKGAVDEEEPSTRSTAVRGYGKSPRVAQRSESDDDL